MGLLDDVRNVINQYTSGGGSVQDVTSQFHKVVDTADQSALSHGIAEALRSDQTPPFPQMVAQLFANATAEQKAGMLSALVAAAPPDLVAKLASIAPGVAADASAPIPLGAAGGVSPDAVTKMAQQVEQQNPGVVERMSTFYAQHPTLVKTLGTAAMMVAMRRIAERRA